MKTYLMVILGLFFLSACNFQKPQIQTIESLGSSWQAVGSDIDIDTTNNRESDMAFDKNNNPFVAFTRGNRIFVSRWNGSTWNLVGNNPLNFNSNEIARNPSIAIDSAGNPVVAWSERFYDTMSGTPGYVWLIRIKHWSGSAWANYQTSNGDLVNINHALNAYSPSLALTSNDIPVIAFLEETYTLGAGYNLNTKVVYYNGTFWPTYAGNGSLNISETSVANSLSMVLDNTNKPVVAWSEGLKGQNASLRVKQWNGTSWILVGGNNPIDKVLADHAFNPSITTNVFNDPIVVWQESNSSTSFTSSQVYFRRLNRNLDGTGSWSGITEMGFNSSQLQRYPSLAKSSTGQLAVAWEEDIPSPKVYVKLLQGGSWAILGNTFVTSNNTKSYKPSLAFDNNGNPTVALNEQSSTGTHNIYVRRYISSFESLGAVDRTLSNNAFAGAITRKSDDQPVIAWVEKVNTSNDLFVREWTGSKWKNLGGRLDKASLSNTYAPQIAMRSDNNPVVAWYEINTSNARNVFVKQWNSSTSSWSLLGTAIPNATLNGLALNGSNVPIITYNISGELHVKKLSNGVWVNMNNSTSSAPLVSYASNASLAMSRTGNPWVAWSNSSGNILIKYWNGGAWIDRPFPSYTADSVNGISLAVDSNNNPIVAWASNYGQTSGQYISRKLFVSRFDGSIWRGYASSSSYDLLNNGFCDSIKPQLKLDINNNPVLAWLQLQSGCGNGGFGYALYVRYWNSTGWTIYANNTNSGDSAANPGLALKSTNLPIISWDEGPDNAHDVFVKQY